MTTTLRPAVIAAGIIALFSPAAQAVSPWTKLTIENFTTAGFHSTALAHLPDGRFVYGRDGSLFVQNTFGSATKTTVPAGSVFFYPSFLAVKDASNAILGRGDFPTSGIHTFNPSLPATGVTAGALATLQEYSGAYWKSASSALEGWLIGGTNGAGFTHDITFVSLDGTKVGKLTGTISTYSGGVATDAAGNVYAARYELDGFFLPTVDANKVHRFSATDVESRINFIVNGSGTATPVPLSSSTFLYDFDGSSSIAVDSAGRVWGSGFDPTYIQVFDPVTSTMSRISPAKADFVNGTDILHTLRTFSIGGTGYVAFLAQDEYPLVTGTPSITGHATTSSLVIPPLDVWRAAKFGVHNLGTENQSTLWGNSTDSDGDGFAQLAEYAFATEPAVNDSTGVITHTFSGGLLSISFPRHPANTDLIYIVEASGTLAANDWTAIASSTAGAVTVASGASAVSEINVGPLKRVTVTDTTAALGHPRRFLRVKIEPIAVND
jgi:hypothetical protein